MNKLLKTLTLALALTSLVMALGSQIPTILPVSPVTEKVEFQKGISVDNGLGLQVGPAGRSLKTWWNFEDFIGGYTYRGIWLTGASGTGASVYDVAGTNLCPGIIRLSTGTTNSGYANISVPGSLAFLFGGGIYTIEANVYITTLSDGTNTYIFRFGFGDSTIGTPTDGAYFYYTNVGGGGATPNWYRNTVSNTTLTSTDTGVAAVAGAWTRLKTIVNADASSVEYFINGTSVGSNTTNIPKETGRETVAIYSLIKSAGTTARTADIDWAWLHVDLATSR